MAQIEIASESQIDTMESKSPSLTELFSGIISDAQLLFRQQVELIRAEFLEDIRRTRRAAQCFGVGAVFLAVGIVMLLVAGVHLVEHLTGWPSWASWASIGGASFLIGAVSFAIGSRILASFTPIPEKSLHALQENVACLTNPPK